MRMDPWLAEHKPEIYWNMLQTAGQVIKRYNIDLPYPPLQTGQQRPESADIFYSAVFGLKASRTVSP